MIERNLRLSVSVMILGAALLLIQPISVMAASKPSLQHGGGRWGSSYNWSKHNASSRSFRFKGAAGRNYRAPSASRYSIFSSKSSSRGATIGSSLASSLRTPVRSYGYAARYSHRQKIVSYRRPQRSAQGNRGSTIRVRRK